MRILDLQTQLDEANDELDSLHKRYQRLARRVSELDPNTPVNALVRMSDLPPVFHWLTNTSQTVRFFAK